MPGCTTEENNFAMERECD